MQTIRRDFDKGFFDNDSTVTAITRLAASERVTIFLGAGVSADQAMPGWLSLVRGLLKERLASDASLKSDPERLANLVLKLNAEVPSASIVDQLFKDQFSNGTEARNNALRTALYGPRPASWRAYTPSLMEIVLELAFTLKAAGKDVHLVSTNYDVLAEWVASKARVAEFMKTWGFNFQFIDRVDDLSRIDDQTTIPYIYLHGKIGTDGSDSPNLVFSEAEYGRWATDGGGFSAYLGDRAVAGALLMVGSSLRDYNIANVLRIHSNGIGPRFALLPIQGDVVGNTDVARDDWPELANLVVARGDHLHLQILRPDFYGQVAQFLREFEYAVACAASSHIPYRERIRDWAENWDSVHYYNADSKRKCENLLRDFAVRLESDHPTVRHAKIDLWVRRDIANRSMERWCSSSTTWNTALPTSWPHVVKIGYSSSHAAVRCFADRTEVHGRVATTPDDDRWSHFLSVPITLDEHRKYTHLPVGAVVAMFDCEPSSRHQENITTVSDNLADMRVRLVELGKVCLAI